MIEPRDRFPSPGSGAQLRDLPPPAPLCDSALGAPPAPPVALFLDFDGTLVEIADHPDAVIVPPTLAGVIARLAARLDGRLAVITGRSLQALESLTGPLDVAVAGSHGGEFRPARGANIEPLALPLPEAVIERMQSFAQDNGGLLVEPKPFSVAVHYRHHPHAVHDLLACATRVGAEFGLALKHGKLIVELAMPGADKGSAVERFMAMPAFAGARPVFAGDDVTDEDAFAVVARLGGDGVLVGQMRKTVANCRLDDVSAVHRWLEAALDDNHKGDGAQ